MRLKSIHQGFFIAASIIFSILNSAHAVQIDWSGQFWFENHLLNNYQLDRSRPSYDNDQDFINRGGKYIPGTGERNVVWYSSFLKLKPKIIVNDSINIRSEWHVGSPIYGFFGRGYPTDTSNKLDFTGSQKQSMSISAQRFWANLITDFGTIEVGRAPIHWGLGAIWNSGDNLFEHYQSTTDTVRLVSKFGNFWMTPFYSKVATGSNVGGATDSTGAIAQGNDDVTDFGLQAKYDNSEEDFEFGIFWNRRSGSFAQRSVQFNDLAASGANRGSQRISYNLYDFYAKKVLGRYTIGGELPLFTGRLGSMDGVKEFEYKAFALIIEGNYTSDLWDVGLKAGHVPGQPNGDADAGQTPGAPAVSAGDTTYRAVYLNKNYGLGLIMFHYNIYGLANNNPDTVAAGSLNSPYDAPIVNANYLSFAPSLKLDRWTMKWTAVVGWASQTAQKGKNFYNHQNRRWYNAIDQKESDQSSFLGKELDYTITYKMGSDLTFSWDLGAWMPGAYYEFTNHPYQKSFTPSIMWASQLRVGLTF